MARPLEAQDYVQTKRTPDSDRSQPVAVHGPGVLLAHWAFTLRTGSGLVVGDVHRDAVCRGDRVCSGAAGGAG